jgi:formylglycine-generating enzyme required for sulfatase activity
MGAVLLVRDRWLDRLVALKVIRGRASYVAQERFVREARAGAVMEHPALVPTFDIGRDGDELFFTMPWVQGRDVAAILQQPPALATLVTWLAAAARGVGYAHQRGLVHRDLKPANLMVDSDGQVVVLDWGLVAPGSDSQCGSQSGAEAQADDGDDRLTLDGALMGTPAYMAPEQAEGKGAQAGPPCDVYALGAILYEFLCGTSPVRVGPLRQMIEQARTAVFEPPSVIAPDREIPLVLEAVCRHAMQRDPALRYPHADAMADDLEAWLAGRPVSVVERPLFERILTWVVDRRYYLLGLLVVALGLAAAWSVQEELRQRVAARREREQAEEQARRLAALQAGAVSTQRAVDAFLRLMQCCDDWRKELLSEDERLVSKVPVLPAMEPAESIDNYYRRCRDTMTDFDWILHEQAAIATAEFDAPSLANRLHAQVLELHAEWRRLADEARQQLVRAGSATGELPSAAWVHLLLLARDGVRSDLRIALANDYDWLSPEILQSAVALKAWRTWKDAKAIPNTIALVWRDVVRSTHVLQDHILRSTSSLEDQALRETALATLREAERQLDGVMATTIEPFSADISAELWCATGEALWAADRYGAFELDEYAGLQRIDAIPAAGRTLELVQGEYLLLLRRGPDVVRHWFLVERGQQPRIQVAMPRTIPAGTALINAADVPIRVSAEGWDRKRAYRARVARSFFMQLHAVSIADYSVFLNANRQPDSLSSGWLPIVADSHDPAIVRTADGRWQLKANLPRDFARTPARGLSFLACALYAQWLSQRDGLAWRIPTHSEWLLAASGPSGRMYPWGNQEDPRRQPCQEGSSEIAPVDGFPQGRSPYGLYLVASNACQYAATCFAGNFVLNLGASFRDSISFSSCGRVGRCTLNATVYANALRLVCEATP